MVFVTLIVAWMAALQAPWKGENLQYFPKDISREALTQRMREFSFALGVRCQYCHAGGNGITFEGVSFGSDGKPGKAKARAMLRMVDEINTVALAQLPSRAEPRVLVECFTCHRGVAIPKSLQTTLFEVARADGLPAAIAKTASFGATRSSVSTTSVNGRSTSWRGGCPRAATSRARSTCSR